MINDKETVRQILHDKLNMKKICVKTLLKKLHLGLKRQPKSERVTCDETWIFQYDPKTK